MQYSFHENVFFKKNLESAVKQMFKLHVGKSGVFFSKVVSGILRRFCDPREEREVEEARQQIAEFYEVGSKLLGESSIFLQYCLLSGPADQAGEGLRGQPLQSQGGVPGQNQVGYI